MIIKPIFKHYSFFGFLIIWKYCSCILSMPYFHLTNVVYHVQQTIHMAKSCWWLQIRFALMLPSNYNYQNKTYREEDVLLVLVDSSWVGDRLSVLDDWHRLSCGREHKSNMNIHHWPFFDEPLLLFLGVFLGHDFFSELFFRITDKPIWTNHVQN